MKTVSGKLMVFFLATAVLAAPFLDVKEGAAADASAARRSAFMQAETEQALDESAAGQPQLTVDPRGYAVDKEFKRLAEIKRETRASDTLYSKMRKRNALSDGDAIYKVAVSDGKLTLKESVEIGLANSLTLRALKKKVDVSRAKLLEARRGLFPTVQAVFDVNSGLVSDRFYRGESQKLNVTQPLFYGGELMYTVKQAEATVKSTEEELKKAKGQLIKDVRGSYYLVVKSEYNLQYQESLFGEVGSIRKRSVQEHEKQVVSDVDYFNVESQYNQAFFQYESSKNDLVTAQLTFFQTIGVDGEEAPVLDLSLGMKKVSPDLYEVLDKALRQNPDIRIKEMALEAAEWGVKIYKAKKLPRVEMRGSIGKLGEVFKDDIAIETDNHDLDTEKEWFLGVNASMPLGPNSIEFDQVKHQYGPTVLALTGSQDQRSRVAFGLFDRLADITDEKSAEATYLQALDDLAKAKDELIVQVKEEHFNLRKALVQIDSAVAKIRYQEKQNDILRYLSSLQESSSATLMEGLVEQAQDKFSFITAVSDYHVAVSNLNIAMGEPDYFESKS